MLVSKIEEVGHKSRKSLEAGKGAETDSPRAFIKKCSPEHALALAQ